MKFNLANSRFDLVGRITDTQLHQACSFAAKMNEKGYLRNHRPGDGTEHRPSKWIVAENLQGKVAEFAVVNAFIDKGWTVVQSPSLWIGDYSKFDNGYDLILKNPAGKKYKIEVKSNRGYAKALMLEYDRYIINKNNKVISFDHVQKDLPDMFVMVNVHNYLSPYLTNYNCKKYKRQLVQNCDEMITAKPEIIIKCMIYGHDLAKVVRNQTGIFHKGQQVPTAHTTVSMDATNYVFVFRENHNARDMRPEYLNQVNVANSLKIELTNPFLYIK